jgi:hypothetical protein
MLKGSTLLELKPDSLALGGLMLPVRVIAVTRFRRTLDWRNSSVSGEKFFSAEATK